MHTKAQIAEGGIGRACKHLRGGLIIAAAVVWGSVFSSCVGAGKGEPAPAVLTEISIGTKHLARPGHSGVFNGGGRLGTAGFSLRGQYLFDDAWREDLPGVKAVPDGAGGSCLTVPSCPGRPSWILVLREVFLPAGGDMELQCEVRTDLEPDTEATPSLYFDFRRINPMARESDGVEARYWIRNGSVKLGKDWQPLRIRFTTPQEDYYGIFVACIGQTAMTKLPTIHLKNLRLTPAAGSPAWAAERAEVAIYADRDVPAYQPGETVRYDVRALLPGATATRESLLIDQVDDQEFTVISTHAVDVQRGQDGVFTGACAFPAARFGSYSARVRQDDTVVDSFGGDFAVVHPSVEHPRGSPGWGIGVNGSDWGRGAPRPRFQKECIVEIWHDTLPRYYEVLRLAGVKVDRNWNFRWGAIEPEQGKFDFGPSDRMLAEHRKYGIELAPVLGSCFAETSSESIPEWVKGQSRRHVVSKEHPMPGYLPPAEAWAAYCRAVMARYQGDIRIWELLNEPSGFINADEYMELLKTTHEVARKVAPEIQVIGPCPTGDALVPRVYEWSQEIIKAGGEKYLDGFSYHPYGAGTDYQKGQFFAATTMIRSIRSWLTNKDLPLYDTECFQLANEKYDRCDRWDASTGLRHYLITLGNGVRFCASFCEYEFFKDRLNTHQGIIRPWVHEAVPAPVAVALNNLSHQLRGTTKAEVLELNGFIRSYLFSGEPEARALAVVWDLRPGGSRWSADVPTDDLQFFDLWGNELPPAADRPLSLDPVYLAGPGAAVGKYLRASRFSVADPLQVTGRAFAHDLVLEAKNLSVMKFSPDVLFPAGGNLVLPTSARFVFEKNSRASVRLPGAMGETMPEGIPFAVMLEKEKLGAGTARLLPATESYVLPTGEAPPLALRLPQGSTATLRAETEGLRILVAVEDSAVVAPSAAFQPWTGDAVEVFIDCAPFAHLDQAQIRTGGERLPVWRYVVPAMPRLEEPAVWTSSQSPEKARAEIRRTEKGYAIDLCIPWKAIPPTGDRYRVYGIEVEIDHLQEPGGVVSKEALSGKPGIAWRERLHYPLFAVPEAVKLHSGADVFGVGELMNGDFERMSERGRPENWNSMWNEDESYPCGSLGYGGSRGVCVRTREPSDKVMAWWQTVPCAPDRATTVVLQALVRAEELRAVAQRETPGVVLSVHFYDDVQKRHMNNCGIGIAGEGILGTFGWRVLQCTLEVPAGATSMTLHCGLRPGTTGAVYFDDVSIKLLDP